MAPGIAANFERILKDAVGEPRYKLWIEGHTKWKWEEGTLLVGVPNRFYRDWMDRQFREAIQLSAATALGKGVAIRFRIDPELFRDRREPEAPAAPPAALLDLQARPGSATPRRVPARYALSRFVVGPCNRVAHAAAASILENPRGGYNPLLIHGGHGLGKTHLLKAVEDELSRRQPAMRIVAVSGEEFTNEFVDSMRSHRLSSFRKQMRTAEAFLVDDVHFLAGKRATQEEFLHTLNSLELRGAKIVLASLVHPRKIDRLSQELQNRFIAGVAACVDPLDRQTQRRLVADKAAERALELSPDVVDDLAERLPPSGSEIEGALNYLAHYSRTFAARLTVDSARRALADVLRRTVPSVRVDEVQKLVCEIFDVHPKSIRLRSRTRAVVHPRMLTLYLARRYTSATYSEIGREIGGLNHSSVIAAERRIQEEIRRDGEIVLGERTWKVRDAVEAFERKLGAR
jgi:chromosomal replication initiator protein